MTNLYKPDDNGLSKIVPSLEEVNTALECQSRALELTLAYRRRKKDFPEDDFSDKVLKVLEYVLGVPGV